MPVPVTSLLINPVRHALTGPHVAVPASRSVANRELVLSAVANGVSHLDLGGYDPGDDVRAMCGALVALGYDVRSDGPGNARVAGSATPPPPRGVVDARMSGTVARFVTVLAALGGEPVRIDGAERLRQRPIGPLARALRDLGATVEGEHLPLLVRGPLTGGAVVVPGNESSQFASALLLSGPRMRDGLDLRLAGSTVNAPFIELTAASLRARGVRVDRPSADRFVVGHQRVRARSTSVAGDVITATYPAAAGAILGGEVTIDNVDARVVTGGQGDARFFDVLERMGCTVRRTASGVTVRRVGALCGVRADLRAFADSFPTLAVVAAVAEGPTEISGIGYTRRHESDRIASVAAGLRALGAGAEELADGLRIDPPPHLHGGTVSAAGDHRVAMAFAVLGLQVPGVVIDDPDCVAKTFPGFFDLLGRLTR
ncbi:MAG: 3-phosphoshikimate 1-carboxyvinyltransferase [Chloroflexi bacterium]|nr:3-phosphoshikimate 1-carboxyvinyltransferase [Chloroflexota bacterium]